MTFNHRFSRPPAAVRRLRFSAAAGATLGLVALLLVAVILGGAVSAYRAFQTIDSLSGQLTDARRQIDGLRDDNGVLSRQNDRILEQNRALVKFLRRHGLKVPKVALPPGNPSPGTGGSGSVNGPKVRTPSGAPTSTPHPGKPTATPRDPGPTHTPSPTTGPGILDPLCALLHLDDCP